MSLSDPKDKEHSGSFQVVETMDTPNPIQTQIRGSLKSITRVVRDVPLKWADEQPLNIALESICNRESLEHVAESGRQPGIRLLMQNYLVGFDRRS